MFGAGPTFNAPASGAIFQVPSIFWDTFTILAFHQAPGANSTPKSAVFASIYTILYVTDDGASAGLLSSPLLVAFGTPIWAPTPFRVTVSLTGS